MNEALTGLGRATRLDVADSSAQNCIGRKTRRRSRPTIGVNRRVARNDADRSDLSTGEYRGETMTEDRDDVGSATGAGASASSAPANSSGPISPATALQRHVEWLEFAL